MVRSMGKLVDEFGDYKAKNDVTIIDVDDMRELVKPMPVQIHSKYSMGINVNKKNLSKFL
jgi:hypothetical protein